MRKFLAVFAVVALLGSSLVAADAVALSQSGAERAVVQHLKARNYKIGFATANCHRLSAKLFGCSYNYFTKVWHSNCSGGAKVRQYPYGLSVTLGRPRIVIDNGGGC